MDPPFIDGPELPSASEVIEDQQARIANLEGQLAEAQETTTLATEGRHILREAINKERVNHRCEITMLKRQLAEAHQETESEKNSHFRSMTKWRKEADQLQTQLADAVQKKDEATKEVELLTQVIEKAVIRQDSTGEVVYGEYDDDRYCPPQELPNIAALEIEVGRLRDVAEAVGRLRSAYEDKPSEPDGKSRHERERDAYFVLMCAHGKWSVDYQCGQEKPDDPSDSASHSDSRGGPGCEGTES